MAIRIQTSKSGNNDGDLFRNFNLPIGVTPRTKVSLSNFSANFKSTFKIETGRNDRIEVSIKGNGSALTDTMSCVIPAGEYSGDQLAQEIEYQLNLLTKWTLPAATLAPDVNYSSEQGAEYLVSYEGNKFTFNLSVMPDTYEYIIPTEDQCNEKYLNTYTVSTTGSAPSGYSTFTKTASIPVEDIPTLIACDSTEASYTCLDAPSDLECDDAPANPALAYVPTLTLSSTDFLVENFPYVAGQTITVSATNLAGDDVDITIDTITLVLGHLVLDFTANLLNYIDNTQPMTDITITSAYVSRLILTDDLYPENFPMVAGQTITVSGLNLTGFPVTTVLDDLNRVDGALVLDFPASALQYTNPNANITGITVNSSNVASLTITGTDYVIANFPYINGQTVSIAAVGLTGTPVLTAISGITYFQGRLILGFDNTDLVKAVLGVPLTAITISSAYSSRLQITNPSSTEVYYEGNFPFVATEAITISGTNLQNGSVTTTISSLKVINGVLTLTLPANQLVYTNAALPITDLEIALIDDDTLRPTLMFLPKLSLGPSQIQFTVNSTSEKYLVLFTTKLDLEDKILFGIGPDGYYYFGFNFGGIENELSNDSVQSAIGDILYARKQGGKIYFFVTDINGTVKIQPVSNANPDLEENIYDMFPEECKRPYHVALNITQPSDTISNFTFTPSISNLGQVDLTNPYKRARAIQDKLGYVAASGCTATYNFINNKTKLTYGLPQLLYIDSELTGVDPNASFIITSDLAPTSIFVNSPLIVVRLFGLNVSSYGDKGTTSLSNSDILDSFPKNPDSSISYISRETNPPIYLKCNFQANDILRNIQFRVENDVGEYLDVSDVNICILITDANY